MTNTLYILYYGPICFLYRQNISIYIKIRGISVLCELRYDRLEFEVLSEWCSFCFLAINKFLKGDKVATYGFWFRNGSVHKISLKNFVDTIQHGLQASAGLGNYFWVIVKWHPFYVYGITVDGNLNYDITWPIISLFVTYYGTVAHNYFWNSPLFDSRAGAVVQR